MLKLETATMKKAIEKAKTVHPRVKVISAAERTYSVTGSKGDNYTVKFAVADGKKLAECDCPSRTVCYHIASASQVNIMVQSMRRQGASPEPTKGAEQITRAEMEASATDAQRRRIDTLAMAIRLRGDFYTLTRDGQDILVEESGNVTRVNPKGKASFDDGAALPRMVKPQPEGTYYGGWSI